MHRVHRHAPPRLFPRKRAKRRGTRGLLQDYPFRNEACRCIATLPEAFSVLLFCGASALMTRSRFSITWANGMDSGHVLGRKELRE